MNPHKVYQQMRAPGQLRIDVILSLYEAVIERLEKALVALRQKDQAAAQKQLAACNLGVGGLVSAFDPRRGELAMNLLRLYDFVVRCLADGSEAKVQAALNVLRTLHSAFVAIRPQAVEMERAGEIPPLDQAPSFQASA
jgi:flagellin-specific chaperone FliS